MDCHSLLQDFTCSSVYIKASQVAPVVKNLPANTRHVKDVGLIPRSGRSPGEGNGNPLQCSCLDNPMDRGARQFSQEGHKESDTTQATQQQQLVYVNPSILIYQPHYLPALSLFHLLCVISPPLKKGSGQTKLPWWIRC